MKYLILLVLLSFLGTVALGQPVPSNGDVVKQLGVRLHQGTVLVHSRHVRSIANSYPRGLEANLAWQRTSEEAWQTCLCYPKLGLALTAWDYDNPEVLGWGMTGLFYLEPVFNAPRRLSFSIRAGLGLSWQSNPHNPETNPLNLSYSTSVAFPLQLGGSLHYRLSPRWTLDVMGVYNHFSNGGIREPNKGINWPSVAVGTGYYLDAPRLQERDPVDWRAARAPATRLDLTFFTGIEQPVNHPYVFFPGVEVKYSRQVARLNALTGSVAYFHDRPDRYDLREVSRPVDPHKLGIAIGHEFLFGDFIFGQQFGAYLSQPYTVSADVYQRYSIVYRWTPHFSLGIGLHSHGHVADFIDVRVAYSWLPKK